MDFWLSKASTSEGGWDILSSWTTSTLSILIEKKPFLIGVLEAPDGLFGWFSLGMCSMPGNQVQPPRFCLKISFMAFNQGGEFLE